MGQFRYKEEVLPGEHPGIVDPGIFAKTRNALKERNFLPRGMKPSPSPKLLLSRLIHCVPCGYVMGSSSSKKAKYLYRYYVCENARKRGWSHCPAKSVTASDLERLVVEQLKGVGTDKGLVAMTLAQAEKREQALVLGLEYEQRTLATRLVQHGAELRGITLNPDHTSERILSRIAKLQEKIAERERRRKEIPAEIERLRKIPNDESEQLAILGQFDQVTQPLVEWVETQLEGRFRLTINRWKTRTVDLKQPSASVDFLGYRFRFDHDLFGRGGRYLNMVPSKRSLARLRDRVRELTASHRGLVPVPDLVRDVTRYLRGWGQYFAYGYPRRMYNPADSFVLQRLVRHLR